MRVRCSSLSIAAFGAAALLLTLTSPGSAASPGHGKGAENLGDPDYGVCRGTDPAATTTGATSPPPRATACSSTAAPPAPATPTSEPPSAPA